MATYATAADVAVELGRAASSPEETAQWEAWLDRVERAIRRAFVQAGLVLEDQVALGDPTAEDVRDVEVAAVIRKITNPSGYTSVTRSVDDASITYRSGDNAGATDPLALLASELEALLPASSSGAFSTSPGFEADTSGTDGPPYWWGYEVGNWPGPSIG